MGNSVAQTDLDAMERLLIDDDVDTILDAMKAAADNGAKRSWPYIRKTLANWRKNGRGVKAEGGTQSGWDQYERF
jgi:DnaD/phage-associated family protein